MTIKKINRKFKKEYSIFSYFIPKGCCNFGTVAPVHIEIDLRPLTKYALRVIGLGNFLFAGGSMKDAKLADVISSLPDNAALAGIRAYILHEGLKGNLEDATKAFEQVWQCEGHEGIKAELTEFLVARYAYRGNLETARKLYARFASLGTSGDILREHAAALHIFACMVMDVKLAEAINLWRDYVHRPIPSQFKKLSAHTGLAELRQALKNSDTRSANLVFSTLCALAQETGDEKIAHRAQEVFEKGAAR